MCGQPHKLALSEVEGAVHRARLDPLLRLALKGCGFSAAQSEIEEGAFAPEERMKLSVFVGTSLDGFIARRNGAFDFLPADGGEPHGYKEFIASVDAIVMGRNTFEIVLTMNPWPYGDKRVVVLSSRTLDLSAAAGAKIEQMSGDPAQIVAKLAATGAHHLYIDGGDTIQRFLRAGLVNRIVITRVPVLIGDGISLFSTLPHDIRLRHISTKQYPSGLVSSEYHILDPK